MKVVPRRFALHMCCACGGLFNSYEKVYLYDNGYIFVRLQHVSGRFSVWLFLQREFMFWKEEQNERVGKDL